MAGDDKLSTMNSETSTLMWVVHPSGSSAGVWRLQPNSEPDEQPTESSQLAVRQKASANSGIALPIEEALLRPSPKMRSGRRLPDQKRMAWP